MGRGTRKDSDVDPDGVKYAWGYYDGQAQLAGSTIIGVESPYHLKYPLPPVTVLTGPVTASSGEAITVDFRGRPHTRSFGSPTNGVPTANGVFTLSDGALLVLTVAVDADRSGQTYDSAIAPDQGSRENHSHLHFCMDFASLPLREQPQSSTLYDRAR